MLDCNTYVIRGSPGIIVDPGSGMSLPALLEGLSRDGIRPGDIGLIVNTHLHGDHCAANEGFREASGASISLHPLQKQYYDVAVLETARVFGLPPAVFTEDGILDGDTVSAGDTEWRLIPSPGHSPDSICYYCPQEKVLICGDVIFDKNTGRVDLPGGNAAALRQSIEDLAQLEVAWLLPGHMDTVSGAGRVRSNFSFITENVLRWL